MRNAPNMRVEKFRVREGELASDTSYGNNGAFIIIMRCIERYGYIKPTVTLRVVVSDEESWDHVSVSVDVNPPRCPTWEEMNYIKDLFFRDDETVVQFHPKKEEYVNCHKYTLRLWRYQHKEHQLPPSWMIGPKTGEFVVNEINKEKTND